MSKFFRKVRIEKCELIQLRHLVKILTYSLRAFSAFGWLEIFGQVLPAERSTVVSQLLQKCTDLKLGREIWAEQLLHSLLVAS